MLYLAFDENGYFAAVCSTKQEMPGVPGIEALGDLDITRPYIHAYKWDGEKLVADEAKMALIREEEKKKSDQLEKAAALKEAQEALVTEQINTLSVDDSIALRWRLLYPNWSPDSILYRKDVKVQFDDKLFKCRQEHTSQANYSPDRTASLWTEINETHSGAVDDPIPYNGNMALENGKYYTQYEVKYKCTRDTINPVYNDLKDLVGLYVEVAT